jgi:DNA polymerase
MSMPTADQVAALLDEVRHALTTLSRRGCPGFDASSESIETVMRWGKAPQAATTPEPGVSAAASAAAAAAPAALESLGDLKEIRTALGDCRRCNLAQGRRHIVFGTGSPEARLVFVGEGPGHEEDLRGEPFVGPAGELLSKIIAAMALTREAVYICNVVKCRPPGNRLPEPKEMAACLPFLKAQLAAIRPTVICTLGACASQALLATDAPISTLRGRFHPYGDSPGTRISGCRVMPTFHPAYLLRHPEAKRAVWNDMQKIMAALGSSTPA